MEISSQVRAEFEAELLAVACTANFERYRSGRYKVTWVEDHFQGWLMGKGYPPSPISKRLEAGAESDALLDALGSSATIMKISAESPVLAISESGVKEVR